MKHALLHELDVDARDRIRGTCVCSTSVLHEFYGVLRMASKTAVEQMLVLPRFYTSSTVFYGWLR